MTDDAPEPPKKPKLQDASTNPWYVLMTVARPQPAQALPWKYDEDLHARNRRYWNGWMAQALSAEEKQALIDKGRATEADLADLTADEQDAIAAAFAARCPDADLPDSNNPVVHVAGSDVHDPVVCQGFVFAAWINFQGTTFRDVAFFEGTTFRAVADFQGTTFHASAFFQGTTFRGRADFQGTTFRALADFEGTTFRDLADFQGTTFRAVADFRGTTFRAVANFRGTTFCGEADFEGTTFRALADFRVESFEGRANFDEVKFREDADFGASAFVDDAHFLRAQFEQAANFSLIVVKGNADFRGTRFLGFRSLSGRRFDPSTTFRSAQFYARADFTDADFQTPTDFAQCAFVGEPPRYFNANLHQDIRWKEVDPWPLPSGDDARDRADYFIRSYERLKLLMADQNKVADELMFQRLELRCREIAEAGTLSALGSRLYGWSADYGLSLRLPLMRLGVLVVLGWALIFLAEVWDHTHGDWSDRGPPEFLTPGQAMGVSLSNTFGFLGLSRVFLREELGSLTMLSEIVSGVQTFLGLVLLFLLGLGLRNRFRLK